MVAINLFKLTFSKIDTAFSLDTLRSDLDKQSASLKDN